MPTLKRKSKVSRQTLPVLLTVGLVVLVGILYVSQQNKQNNKTPASVLGSSDGAATTVGAKEFFVPFGFSIANNVNDWADIPGLSVTVDSSQYPKIKQVLFEVTAFVPTGNQTIWLRLRNYDGYSYPTVTMDGSGPKLLVSEPFAISPGTKSYYVQLKTQLGYPVHIYQARLHITTY